MRASRSVLSKHATIQGQNLSIYGKTSSLAKAINFRTDRPFRPASVLFGRANQLEPSYSKISTSSRRNDDPIPKTTSSGAKESNVLGSGKDQDQFYEKPVDASASNSASKRDITFNQERAKGKSLPDGTILPQNSEASKLERDGNKVTADQEPLEESGNENNFKPKASSTSSTPLPARDDETQTSKDARVSQRLAESQIPDQTTGSSPPQSVRPHAVDRSNSGITVSQDQDTFYSPPIDSGPSFSSLPRTKIPKATENSQGSDDQVHDEGLNQDVYYSPDSDKAAAAQSSSFSKGQYSELFRSPKVARMLQKEPEDRFARDPAKTGESSSTSADIGLGNDLSHRSSEADEQTKNFGRFQYPGEKQQSTTNTGQDGLPGRQNAQEVSKVNTGVHCRISMLID